MMFVKNKTKFASGLSSEELSIFYLENRWVKIVTNAAIIVGLHDKQ